jgi:hypothetical protein
MRSCFLMTVSWLVLLAVPVAAQGGFVGSGSLQVGEETGACNTECVNIMNPDGTLRFKACSVRSPEDGPPNSMWCTSSSTAGACVTGLCIETVIRKADGAPVLVALSCRLGKEVAGARIAKILSSAVQVLASGGDVPRAIGGGSQ